MVTAGRVSGGRRGLRFAVGVGDHEVLGGSGDGDAAAVVQPVVERAQQDQVVELGGPAVLPMPDVMGVQTAGRPAAGDHAAAVAVLQRSAQPAADLCGSPAPSR